MEPLLGLQYLQGPVTCFQEDHCCEIEGSQLILLRVDPHRWETGHPNLRQFFESSKVYCNCLFINIQYFLYRWVAYSLYYNLLSCHLQFYSNPLKSCASVRRLKAGVGSLELWFRLDAASYPWIHFEIHYSMLLFGVFGGLDCRVTKEGLYHFVAVSCWKSFPCSYILPCSACC